MREENHYGSFGVTAQKRISIGGKTKRARGKSHVICTFAYSLNDSNSPSPIALSKLNSVVRSKLGYGVRKDEFTTGTEQKPVYNTMSYVAFPIGQGTKFQGKTMA